MRLDCRPRDVMLVLVRETEGDTLYMALPNDSPLWGGFTEIPVKDLPKKAKIVIADQARFNELFEPQLY